MLCALYVSCFSLFLLVPCFIGYIVCELICQGCFLIIGVPVNMWVNFNVAWVFVAFCSDDAFVVYLRNAALIVIFFVFSSLHVCSPLTILLVWFISG